MGFFNFKLPSFDEISIRVDSSSKEDLAGLKEGYLKITARADVLIPLLEENDQDEIADVVQKMVDKQNDFIEAVDSAIVAVEDGKLTVKEVAAVTQELLGLLR